MATIKTTRLCEGLGVSRDALNQWISRGLIKPEAPADLGYARDWALRDVLRVAISARLLDTGIRLRQPEGAGGPDQPLVEALRYLRGFKRDRAFLLVQAPLAGSFRHRLVPGAQLAEALLPHPQHPPLAFSVAIDLDAIEAEVLATFPELRDSSPAPAA